MKVRSWKEMEHFFLEVNIYVVKCRFLQEQQIHISECLHRKQPFRFRSFITIGEINISEERTLLISRENQVSSWTTLDVSWLTFLDKINSVNWVTFQEYVLSLCDFDWFEQRSYCGNEIRRLVREISNSSDLLSVHQIWELDFQLSWQLWQ